MNLSDLGEKGLIERLRAQLNQAGGRGELVVDVGDDTAAFRAPGADKLQLFTVDMMVEGTHFRRQWHWPGKLGWKALAVNISDIAAMGGRPTFAVVSVGLPSDIELEFIDRFYTGLLGCAQKYGVVLVGGDSVRAPQIVIDVALLGEVAPEQLVRRSGAQVGDVIAVTGPLGGAAAGLKLLESGARGAKGLASVLLEPMPRLAEGQALAASGAVHAMMDLSDGLADDLPRLCQESGVGARLYFEQIPIHPVCQQFGDPNCALQGGEDYELLFACAPGQLDIVNSALAGVGAAPANVVGEILPAEVGIQLVGADGRIKPLAAGYQHFGA